MQAVFSGMARQPFIDLTWSPNSEPDLAGYNVYRRVGGEEPVKINSELIKTPAYQDAHVQAGTKYFYSVSAIDLLRSEPRWQIDARSGRPAAELARDLADADALLVRSATKVTAELLASAPKLRIVGRAGTGVDNIDVAACTKRGVVATNTPGVLDETTADFAWTLMMAVARRLVEGDTLARSGNWTGWDLDQLVGTDVWGKTLGIVGFGRIGKAMARRAHSISRSMRDCHQTSAMKSAIGAGMSQGEMRPWVVPIAANQMSAAARRIRKRRGRPRRWRRKSRPVRVRVRSSRR